VPRGIGAPEVGNLRAELIALALELAALHNSAMELAAGIIGLRLRLEYLCLERSHAFAQLRHAKAVLLSVVARLRRKTLTRVS
jgi:hypothetical protein